MVDRAICEDAKVKLGNSGVGFSKFGGIAYGKITILLPSDLDI
jgi:hypothetical protein